MDDLSGTTGIVAGLVGLSIGSFLNVCICRWPADESVISPPSRCPGCNHELAWYDNVPILGYLWLRGACRYCQRPISIQYPIIELVTASVWVAAVLMFVAADIRAFFAWQILISVVQTGVTRWWLFRYAPPDAPDAPDAPPTDDPGFVRRIDLTDALSIFRIEPDQPPARPWFVPGQYCVLYAGELCLGGGEIVRAN